MKTRIYLCLCVASLVLLASAAIPRSASASEDQKIPRLGPHTFVPNSSAREPFIVSHIRNNTGIGYTNNVQVPLVTLPDGTELGDLNTAITVALIGFEVQQALKSWVAVRGSFEILGRLGTTTESLLSEGVTGLGSFELGWIFKLLQSERDALSMDLFLRRDQGSFINLLDWLDRIIEEGGLLPGNSLVQSRDSMRGLGGLSYAHGFSPLLGMSANGNLGYGERPNRDGKNDFVYSLNAGLSLNLRDVTNFPFGLYLGYGFSNLREANRELDGVSQNAVLRVSYMGFQDFVVGLDMGFSTLPVEELEEPITGSIFVFSLRYYH